MSIDYKKRFFTQTHNIETDITNAISYATCATAHDLGAVAIMVITTKGNTARRVSRFKPATRIFASTPQKKAYMQMSLFWGITPLLHEALEAPDQMFGFAVEKARQDGLAKDGELIVITGSSSNHYKFTNSLQVHVL